MKKTIGCRVMLFSFCVFGSPYSWGVAASGVFKGRRARHFPRASPFWRPPLRCYTCKVSLFLIKTYYSLI